jgi:glycosyltransferase involved in cell wall biosynthesis
MSAPTVHHEIEHRPLRAEAGRLAVRGWCLVDRAAPPVRLRVGEQVFTPSERFVRPDVNAAHDLAGNLAVGFVFTAQLPAGAQLAIFEAEVAGQWRCFRRLVVIATGAPLAGQVERPLTTGTLRTSARIEGWCAHPTETIAALELRYGNIRLPCEHGLARTDVAALVPGSPDATRAGFISAKNLPASRGPLRVRAQLRSGRVLFLHPPVAVDIDRDADLPQPLALPAARAALDPARRPHPAAVAPGDGAPLRVLFALYGDFTSNSAIHVLQLAAELERRGHRCFIAVPHHPETAAYFPANTVRTGSFAEVEASGERFDAVHAWTTRENVRLFCAALRQAGRVDRVFVQLEDNELRILELTLGRTLEQLRALPAPELDRLVPPSLSHPVRSQEFLGAADGVTVIIDTLRAHVPAGRPVATITPAADRSVFFPRPRPLAFRRALGWDDRHIVLMYHGNVHAANRTEVLELYRAVGQLNAAGLACTLLRTGRSDEEFHRAVPAAVRAHVIELGVPRHHQLGRLLALADYFVQPGEADAFNDFRLPSKLPEFFALGRPVILPRTNLGRTTRHGVDAYVLDRADAAGIAAAIGELHRDPALRQRLSDGALEFARTHFDWAASAGRLENFYRRVLGAA